MPEPATIALDLTYAECGRSPRPGETWRILFADVGEAFIFCPECAVRAGLTPRGVRGLPHAEWGPSPMAMRPLDASVDLNRIEEDAMTWKLALAALAALVATAATPAAAGPSQGAKAVSVNFRMVEWDILPLTATKTRSTRVTFVVRNAGKMTHEFVVLKTAKAAGRLAAPGAREAPETGAQGEIEAIKPGETKRLTLSLKKGHYSLICNLPFHYGKGQFVDFYIR